MTTTYSDGGFNSFPLTLISNIAWEPYGGLRGYQITFPTSSTNAGVEYALGDNGTTVPSTSCSSIAFPATSTSDHAGRTRALWVSGGAFTPGSGAGDLLKQEYTWTGDQVTQMDSCALGASTPQTETFGYDQMARVISTGRPTGNFSSTGGAFGSRSYTYDGRGNRLTDVREDTSWPLTYGTGNLIDHLTKQGPSTINYNYTFDADGRVTTKAWNGSNVPQNFTVSDLGSGSTGSDSVYKTVSVNGSVYAYWYDGSNHRWLKQYPTSGVQDEFFYNLEQGLLVDQGNSSSTSPTAYPDDNYVWLGGRPIVLVRGQLSTAWALQSDSTASCGRNGDSDPCGFYFPITDQIGKPVMMLNASGQAVGITDYDVFGRPNTVSFWATGTVSSGQSVTLNTAKQGSSIPNTQTENQVAIGEANGQSVPLCQAFVGIKTPSCLGTIAWSMSATSAVYHRVSTWVGGDSCVGLSTGTNCSGAATTEWYKYRRHQTSTNWFWTPLGFPGQYYDTETDLVQNWNRFYDPGIGRYLEPEPMMSQPKYVQAMAHQGHSVPVYAYAFNNPIANTDPTGLYGTNSCEYYQERCAEAGGDYYCNEAQYWCNWFRKPPKPPSCPAGDNSTCWEGWPRCVRQCLQDCDRAKHPEPMCPAKPDSDKGPWNPTSPSFDCHLTCYTACAAGFDGTIGGGKAGSNGGM